MKRLQDVCQHGICSCHFSPPDVTTYSMLSCTSFQVKSILMQLSDYELILVSKCLDVIWLAQLHSF